MSKSFQCLRGMRDMTPEQSAKMHYIETILAAVAKQYGFKIINFPIIESLSLFQKSIGIETDIIGQEMYAFEDKNEQVISLRPEGTAGCLRSTLSNGLIQRTRQKLFYIGPMFRRERPQRGRYRQFQHFGVEVFGYPSGNIEVELILMSYRIWQSLSLENITLHVNYLGSPDSRKHYHTVLSQYWQNHADRLSDAELLRAKDNPLRLLDSKNPDIADLIENAPAIENSLNESENKTYQHILKQLDMNNIAYIKSHRLVRGLDYYSDFIFEWMSSDLGSQSTICGGGRYDSLVASMGENTPAIGFAIGIDRVAELVNVVTTNEISIYVCSESDELLANLMPEFEKIRHEYITLNIDCIGGKIKNKVNTAMQENFHYVAIIQDADNIKLISLESDTSETLQLNDFKNWYLGLTEGDL